MPAILEIERLTRRFGRLTAVDDLCFAIDAVEIRSLIGPNDAGKTATFNVKGSVLKTRRWKTPWWSVS